MSGETLIDRVYIEYIRVFFLTLLVVQQEVAVLIAASDGVRNGVSVRVVGVNDGDQRVWTSILTEKGLIADK